MPSMTASDQGPSPSHGVDRSDVEEPELDVLLAPPAVDGQRSDGVHRLPAVC